MSAKLSEEHLQLEVLFHQNFGVDPPILNGDQMSFYRNESSGQATLRFKNKNAFVKENHHLSRERVTVFKQIAIDGGVDLYPEFVFKGTCKRPPKLTTHTSECSLPMCTKRFVPLRTAP